MITRKQFLQDIERFMRRTGTSATRLSWDVFGSPSWVAQLRAGADPKLGSVERVYEYMAEVEAELAKAS